ncbi:hypothetical protein Y1Q_0020759 [Alligator mississippiensis]|uniref:Uncharacterized protein n=1 Tax=Alligator mississippiensis TaxID=8496 RepID=A0A151MLE9_ALLMI|nr:hypothetical protein Y1Q_0020759 [Alligator mississippiensis]
MVQDQRCQLRREESRQKKERYRSERVLQTFKSTVEVITPHSSRVMSPGQKPLASTDSGSPFPVQFSITPLSSWYHPSMIGASTSSQYYAEPAFSEHRTPSTYLLSQSEPYSASQDIPPSDLDVKYYSQPNLNRREGTSSREPGAPISQLGKKVCVCPYISSGLLVVAESDS